MSTRARPAACGHAGGVLAVLAVAVLAVAGCAAPARDPSRRAAADPPASPAVSVPATPAIPPVLPPVTVPAAAACRAADGFSCAMTARISLVQRYLAGRPGRIGIVLHDRQTGATWHSPGAGQDLPAASTIKLAMAADLLLRNGSGQIHLSGRDWNLLHQALHASSDAAASQLWGEYEGPAFLARIRAFGMGSAYFTTPGAPQWGFIYCSAADLDNLMNYVLGRIPAGARLYLTRQLRHVAPIQQWGVWGAGPGARPGNKDGWEDDSGTWVTDTVGFAGPGARYTLAIMYDTGGARGFHYGTVTLSQVAALLFQGHPGPEPTVQATP